jgi:dihydrofolate synthase/folylpolyglutamate synthase
VLSAGGYRVGTFTSPHLIRYNERICIAGQEVSDDSLIAAFERIERARGDISLTFFEFNALAALLVFDTAGLDAMVLEVGLGGRLDAVNIVDADVAIVSSIALDHCDWLGNDIETIGREKAGIFRPGRVAIFGSHQMPNSVANEALRIGATLLQLGRDFAFRRTSDGWSWHRMDHHLAHLSVPGLPGDVQLENAAAVLTALDCLQTRLPLKQVAIDAGLRTAKLAGRFQVTAVSGNEWILDVAHNPAAAMTLAHNLFARPCAGRTVAVCGVFADKDATGIVAAVRSQIAVWVVTGVSGARALPPTVLAQQIADAGATVAHIADDVVAACEFAQLLAMPGDRIVVFGSFHTVGPALSWLASGQSRSEKRSH